MEFKSANLVYFSGTGGTARVADAFERSFSNQAVTVYKTELKGNADPDVLGDILILLFPVYALNAPKPIDEWLEKIQSVEGTRAVVVSVSGGGEISPNTACRVATIRRLEKKGYAVIYEKMVVMPSNFLIGFDDSLCAMVLHAMPAVVDKMVKNILAGKQYRTTPYGIDRVASKLGYFEKFGGKFFGKHLKVTDQCVNCGWCVNLCPRDNIKIIDGKHYFGEACVICLGCIYGCPQHAIKPGFGKFMILPEGFNLTKVENRMDHLTVYPKISQATNHTSLRGVREYLIESDCFNHENP